MKIGSVNVFEVVDYPSLYNAIVYIKPIYNVGTCLWIENDITRGIGYVRIHSMPAQYPLLFVL